MSQMDEATSLIFKAFRDDFIETRKSNERVIETLNGQKIQLANFSAELDSLSSELDGMKSMPGRVDMMSYRLGVMEKERDENKKSARKIFVNIISTLLPWVIAAIAMGAQFINTSDKKETSHEQGSDRR